MTRKTILERGLLQKMGAVKEYLLKNWFWIAVGIVFTKLAIKAAYIERGYLAYGGEWLVLPLLLMGAVLARNICDAVKYMLGMKEYL